MDFIIQNFQEFLTYTGFANATAGNLIMILVGIVCIWLAIKKDFEPLLLVPIGLGIILGNIPFRTDAGLEIGLYEDNSVLNIFYQGVRQGWYPPLVFLGIGAMTDFSALISNPKLIQPSKREKAYEEIWNPTKPVGHCYLVHLGTRS